MDALAKAGCEKVFTDKASSAKADRPGLAEALRFARAGDCLVIWKLDRLGRSIQGSSPWRRTCRRERSISDP